MWWRTKFADENTIPQQLEHILSEYNEVEKEWLEFANSTKVNYKIEKLKCMKQESLDLIQSVYTLLHMLGMTEPEHEKMKWEMEVKNWERGYYKR